MKFRNFQFREISALITPLLFIFIIYTPTYTMVRIPKLLNILSGAQTFFERSLSFQNF